MLSKLLESLCNFQLKTFSLFIKVSVHHKHVLNITNSYSHTKEAVSLLVPGE